jgi:hypothetical protein
LNGKNSSPVADELLRHEVPFILVTGYCGHKADPPVLAHAKRMKKPINYDELADRMTEAFVRRPLEHWRAEEQSGSLPTFPGSLSRPAQPVPTKLLFRPWSPAIAPAIWR